jgi:modification target Cys-rich repeat protein
MKQHQSNLSDISIQALHEIRTNLETKFQLIPEDYRNPTVNHIIAPMSCPNCEVSCSTVCVGSCKSGCKSGCKTGCQTTCRGACVNTNILSK